MNTNYINNPEYNNQYNSSWNGRLRTAKQYHAKKVGKLTIQDDLTANDLQDLYLEQNRTCPCCGSGFRSSDDCDIAHIENKGHFTKSNIMLICHHCNMMQKDLWLPFNVVFRTTNLYFLDFFIANEDKAIELFDLSPNDVKRIWKRINS